MVQNDLNDSHRKALIFQRRQLQNERNVEEIVRTNTEKVDEINVFVLIRLLIFTLKFRHFMNVVEITIHLQKLDQHFHHPNDFKYQQRTVVHVFVIL
jgi:hypothetical protein